MKRKKSGVIFIIAIVMLCFASCGNNQGNKKSGNNNSEFTSIEEDNDVFIKDVEDEDYIYYEYINHIQLVGMNISDVEEVIIPDYIDGKPVTELGNNYQQLLQNKKMELDENGNKERCKLEKLNKIVIPDTIEIINNYTFYDGIADDIEIEIPDSVKYIGARAFKRGWLEKFNEDFVIVGDGVLIWVNDSATVGDTITVPEGVKVISGLRKYDKNVKKIVLPTTLTRFGCDAIDGDLIGESLFIRGVETMVIPDSVKIIDICFGSMTTENILKMNDKNISEDFYVVGDGICCGYKKDKTKIDKNSIEIPEGVKCINNKLRSFELDENIDEFTLKIPESCENIEWLGMVYSPNSEVKLSVEYPDYYKKISRYEKLYDLRVENYGMNIPEDIVSIGYGTFEEVEWNSLKLPDSIISIEPNAFYYNRFFNKIDLNNVKYIGCGAFFGHGWIDEESAVFDITIPSSVKFMGGWNFSFMPIENIVIEDGLEEISEYCFCNNTKMKKVYIPESVKSIGKGCFQINSSEKQDGEYIYEFSEDLEIHGKTGSYAEEYAKENGVKFVVE